MPRADDFPADRLMIPISLGELLDRISILELKQQHVSDAARRVNVTRELGQLARVLEHSGRSLSDPDLQSLREVNAALWDLEDRIRLLERQGLCSGEYACAARDIHRLNDARHNLKRSISVAGGSAVVEEKEYSTTL